MSTKSGRALRAQESRLFQTELARMFPILSQMERTGGRLRSYRRSPAIPVPKRENPIQSP